MKLLVVILCYKVPELTVECLRSLAGEVTRVPGTRVVVCENGTGGDSAEQIRRAIDDNGWGSCVDLTVIYPNLGFTGGNNVVIREALASADPPEYVLLLNADTVVQPHALDALVDFMEAHPQAGIAGSQLFWPDGRLQSSPYRAPGILSELERGINLGIVSRLVSPWSVMVPTPDQASPWDWVSGASMILRRAVLEQIGLLDEGLYTYFDDIDICLRARRAGWESWYVPASKITHFEGSSTGLRVTALKRRPDYWFQARRRCYLANYGPVRTALMDAAYLFGATLNHLRLRVTGKLDTLPPYTLWDSFRHSVFVAGFAIEAVQNPALAAPAAPASVAG